MSCSCVTTTLLALALAGPGAPETLQAPEPSSAATPAPPVTTTIELVGDAPPESSPCPPHPDHAELKSARGMLAAGIVIGGIAYLSTSMAGAVAIDRARDFEDDPLTEDDEAARGRDRRAFGVRLLVPVVGPFVAAPRADTALRAWAAGLSGVAQGVGVGLAIAGLVRRSRALRPTRYAVAPAFGPGLAGLTVQGRF